MHANPRRFRLIRDTDPTGVTGTGHVADGIAWPVAPDPPKPCPHCPDGHRAPASKPWNVLVHPERDRDGQPTKLIVARPAGEHVAESDADWVYEVLRAAVGQLS